MDQVQESPARLYARKQISKGIYERIGKDGKKTYQVIVRLARHAPQSETFHRLTDARKWQENTKAAIREGRYFKTAEAKKHTLGQLVDRYIRDVFPTKEKSRVKQTAQLLWWKGQIGALSLADITPALIVEKRDELAKGITRSKRPRGPATVVRYLAALSHAFTIAVKEWGWLEDSPMRKVTKPKEPRGRLKFLSEDERHRLLAACKQSSNKYLYTIVVLALSTGMRQGEILNLRWSNVDLEKGRIVLYETKNSEIRVVPLTGHALALIRELDKTRRIDTTLLFPGKENPQKPLDFRFSWNSALIDSGLVGYVFHDCRHSAASELAMNGASLVEIAAILGHKTLSMVKRYAHIGETHTARVVARMNNKIFGGLAECKEG
jgi:integrase